MFSLLIVIIFELIMNFVKFLAVVVLVLTMLVSLTAAGPYKRRDGYRANRN